jgi:hypothetical protein
MTMADEELSSALDDLRAETEAETVRPVDGFIVALVTASGAVDLTVPAPGRWPTKAMRALRGNDSEEWASLVLSEQDYEAWSDANPTNDDAAEFFVQFQQVAGETVGKSRTSQRSSRSTARR